jgi:hypothetical protein
MKLPAPDEVLTIPTARGASVGASFAMDGPVLGYRCWLVERGDDGYRLRSVLWPTQWAEAPGAWTSAVCSPPTDSGAAPLVRHDRCSVPHPDCSCGTNDDPCCWRLRVMHTPMAEELGRAAMDDRRREAARVALESAALDRSGRRWSHVLSTTFQRLSTAMSRGKLRGSVKGSGRLTSRGATAGERRT